MHEYAKKAKKDKPQEGFKQKLGIYHSTSNLTQFNSKQSRWFV